jgi:two-component system, chemotaxis family, sensor kinase CheA
VIRVSDDGRGIQRERVVARALAQGLVSPSVAASLSDDEVYRLLLQPGFSTAEQVTGVSGRGVGLDVVANRVRAVGGTLEITSEPGRGTSFTLRLPLTLAIVQALIVGIGEERFAIPIAHVAETAEVDAAELREMGGHRVVLLREAVVPVLPLAHALELGEPRRTPRLALVVLEIGEQPVALEVDALLGQREIVVKQFDATADTLRAFSGATILSDGRPALILDVGAVPAMLDRNPLPVSRP